MPLTTTTINTQTRRRYSELLRQLLCRSITNDQYEEAFAQLPSEPAVNAIHSYLVWSMYSDLSEHRLSPLTPECRREFATLILFLRTDLPAASFSRSMAWARLNLALVTASSIAWLAGLLLLLAWSFVGLSWMPWTALVLMAPVAIRWTTHFASWLLLAALPHAKTPPPESRESYRIKPHWPFGDTETFSRVLRHGSGLLGSPQPLFAQPRSI